MLDSMDRRGSARVSEYGGIVTCHSSSERAHYRVRDLSSTGIGLEHGPDLALGTPVDMQLSWPGVGHGYARGIVCRVADLGPSQGVNLGVQVLEQEGIDSLLCNLFAIEQLRASAPRVLVCGSSPLAEATADELEGTEVDVLRARFPLEVISAVQDPWKRVSRVVFAQEAGWAALAGVVANEAPQARRLLVVDADHYADFIEPQENKLIDTCMRGPWITHDLLRAIDIRPQPTIRESENIEATKENAMAKQSTTEGTKDNNKLQADTPCRCLSCGQKLTELAAPLCAACLDWSRNITEFDDLGCGD